MVTVSQSEFPWILLHPFPSPPIHMEAQARLCLSRQPPTWQSMAVAKELRRGQPRGRGERRFALHLAPHMTSACRACLEIAAPKPRCSQRPLSRCCQLLSYLAASSGREEKGERARAMTVDQERVRSFQAETAMLLLSQKARRSFLLLLLLHRRHVGPQLSAVCCRLSQGRRGSAPAR